MVSGAFKSFKHDHIFQKRDTAVVMTETFYFQTPFGIFGKLAKQLFLKAYMRKLLFHCAHILKLEAEQSAKL